jgi:predicted DNA-binding protein
MRKTSLYLSDNDSERLRRVAEREGRSQSEVVRLALAEYEAVRARTEGFALFAVPATALADARSIAEIPDEELMEGFGE